MTALLVIAIFVVLIVVHEFGHFLVAKLTGVRVDKFGIGYPPRAPGPTTARRLTDPASCYAFCVLPVESSIQLPFSRTVFHYTILWAHVNEVRRGEAAQRVRILGI
jgi:hypothetical protein